MSPPPAAGGGTRQARTPGKELRPGASPSRAASTSSAALGGWQTTTGTPACRFTGEWVRWDACNSLWWWHISEDLLTWILVGMRRELLRIDLMLPSPTQMTQSRWDVDWIVWRLRLWRKPIPIQLLHYWPSVRFWLDDASIPGQRDKVLLLLQAENAEEKNRPIEVTARLWEDSEISKSRVRGQGWFLWGGRARGWGGAGQPTHPMRGTETFKKWQNRKCFWRIQGLVPWHKCEWMSGLSRAPSGLPISAAISLVFNRCNFPPHWSPALLISKLHY